MTLPQRREDMNRSKFRRYVVPIIFALAVVSSDTGVFMCPGVELGLCCKKFVVMDGQRLGQDCKRNDDSDHPLFSLNKFQLISITT